MNNRSYCSQAARPPATDWAALLSVFPVIACMFVLSASAHAGDAPSWMHAVVNAPLPPHDEKTDAVLLYSDTNVSVISTEKIKTVERRVYKILRPEGREYGTVLVPFRSPREKVNNMRAWCIPAQGKDYEVKDKDAIEASLPKVDGSELISDVRAKILRIPASDPGNVVGYEYEMESNPLVLQTEWIFQHEPPVHEGHFSLLLPPGWEYKAAFLNYPDVKPTQAGPNSWQWSVTETKGLRKEQDMPPSESLAGQMIISFLPPGGQGAKGFANWQEMGNWALGLANGRRDASPEIRQKVVDLTKDLSTTAAKMKAIASFVQSNVRYVEIALGNGWQPHPAADIFVHRYGDCKDKATLMASMLHEIGVDSYYLFTNLERGGVRADTPAHRTFDHAILAIKLPPDAESDRSLIATIQHPKLGKLLIFDPTNDVTPFGQIGGYLQSNYSLLATPEGGELIELPQWPSAANGLRRSAKLTLDAQGNLHGEVEDVLLGDLGWSQRDALRSITNDKDRIKPIENVLSGSLSNFGILKASVVNPSQVDKPFGYRYSFEAANYAKNAGGMLLVRPRVIGVKAQAIMETKEPRQYPIEFEGPVLDTDHFEITLPPGYVVDDVPPPVDADFGFAAYHSKTEVKGNVLAYSRSFEIKELSVPVSRAQELKKFYRIIASDERNTAILKPAN